MGNLESDPFFASYRLARHTGSRSNGKPRQLKAETGCENMPGERSLQREGACKFAMTTFTGELRLDADDS
jgi:hypothetical protein